MYSKRLTFVTAVLTGAIFLLSTTTAFASAGAFKKGMEGSAVTALQKDLKKLGYLSTEPTGYYGDLTVQAVKAMQAEYGYDADGIAGETTLALVDRLLGRNTGSGTVSASASGGVLKEGGEGGNVTQLQKDLKKLGYFSGEATGYFGEVTTAAVKKFQKSNGLGADGVAGGGTLALIKKLTAAKAAPKTTATAQTTAATAAKTTAAASKTDGQTNYMLPWFNTVNDLFKVGTTATVYDIDSGLSFKIKRTYGHNHADCEPLTSGDTAIMKKIYGGTWSWDRKAVIVTVGSKKIAASMAGMPHAGVDSSAANKVVSSRSGGYGRGENLDAIKKNGMSGHFDLHFYGSKTHDSNKVDSAHQKMVKKAAEWAENNL